MRHYNYSKSAKWLKQRRLNRSAQKQQGSVVASYMKRLMFAVIAGLFGLLLGGLFDLTTALLRTFAQPQSSAAFSWFLAYMFAAAGIILGFFFGSRSGEFFSQLFAADDKGPSKASSELIRLIAKTLLVAGIIWSIFLIFLS